jgi:ABC-type antimicrobial peptide transport system permease subunit
MTTQTTTTTTTTWEKPKGSSIHIETRYPYARAKLWQAFSDADVMSKWLMKTEGYAPVVGTKFVLRAPAGPEALIPAVRATLRDVAPNQPIFLVKTMNDVISDSLQSRKLTLTLLAIFASLALLLSATGIYGVMSYAVSQRQREIGIRMALGARASSVMRMILSEAGMLAAIGLAIGLAAAALLTRVLSSMLYGVGTHDPVTFVAVAALLVTVALAASLVPAWRALRLDPATVFRAE